MSQLGIDISEFQGAMDFEAIAGNIDYVIIRAGYADVVDPQFERSYAECKRLNIPCGTYFYSYALNTEEAQAEADFYLSLLAGKVFEYPIYLDMEDGDHYKEEHGLTDPQEYVAITQTFLSRVEAQNNYVGIYSSQSWFDKCLGAPSLKRYDRWIANWGTNDGTIQVDVSDQAGMLQYTSVGSIEGYEGNVDRDIAYLDYPSIIVGGNFNGNGQNEEPPAQTEYKIGDHVKFESCYRSSTAKIGWPPEGEALVPDTNHGVITAIYDGTNNPYLINDGMCFVNNGDIQGYYEVKQTTYEVGDHVMFNSCYRSSTATVGWPPFGEALVPDVDHGIITAIYDGTNNPYLINDGMCFVNNGDITGYYDKNTYVVQAGDTLSEIAEQYGISYQALAQINQISDPNLIYPGQTLRVP